MKLEYFEYLVAMKEAGSINKSAEMLHTSPQNVSRVLKVMEDELGVELVNRSLAGIEFTEAGLGAVTVAKKILELYDTYLLQYRKNNEIEGELNIFSTKIQSTLYMDDIITKFAKLYPKVKLNYVENDLYICLDKMKSTRNSVGILPVLENENEEQWEDMLSYHLSSERLAIIADKNSTLGRQKKVSYKSLQGQKFVIHSRNDYEDGFWSKVLSQYVTELGEFSMASNGYLFYSKIFNDGFIGLGCERTSPLSEFMQKDEIRERVSVIPIVDGMESFRNCLVVPKEMQDAPIVECLYDFLLNIQND